LAFEWTLTGRDGRAIAADVADKLLSQVLFDERLVNALSQATGGELFKGPREGGLAGQGDIHRETADTAQ